MRTRGTHTVLALVVAATVASCSSRDASEDAAGPRVVQVATGVGHSCALLRDGSVKCWGYNAMGQLGVPGASRGGEPQQMGSNLPAIDLGQGQEARSIAAGSYHTCAVVADGSVKCWGAGWGRVDAASPGIPAVNLGTGLRAIEVVAGSSVGASSHSCARLDDGRVKCWGVNERGQLGLGDTVGSSYAPREMGDKLPFVELGSGRKVVQLTARSEHTCARLDNGAVKCWGSNYAGQLGLGDTRNRGDEPGEMGDALPPVDLGPGRTAVQVSSGHAHTCAVLDDGSLKCWGSNREGQLGLGDTVSRGDRPGSMGSSLPPVNLGTGRRALRVACGEARTCAVLDDGTLRCWGRNFSGELGLGDSLPRGDKATDVGRLPVVDLGTGRTVMQLDLGAKWHSCAVLDDGSVKCWGGNGLGQLGLGDKEDRGDAPGEMGDALPTVQLW
jgi:alpha-tubulin suppressor-like RCC1 family protein